MKKKIIMMALLLSAITIAANGQTEKRIYTSSELRSMERSDAPKAKKEKLTKEQKKAAREISDSLAFEKSLKALNDLNFVLEADRLIFKRGESVYVSPTVNFISVTDDNAVVQVAPFRGGGGPNGVGGITVEGRPSNIMLKTDKHGNVTFSMNVNGKGISAIIDISMAKGSSFVTATVNPNLNSARVTLTGSIATPEESVVFKGRTF